MLYLLRIEHSWCLVNEYTKPAHYIKLSWHFAVHVLQGCFTVKLPGANQLSLKDMGTINLNWKQQLLDTVPGRVLPLCWVIWMCCHFDLLFWHSGDWTRSFGGTFSHPLTPKRSFGSTKTTNPYRIQSFWPQIPFFLQSFWVQFSVVSSTPPSVFGPSTPTVWDSYDSAWVQQSTPIV